MPDDTKEILPQTSTAVCADPASCAAPKTPYLTNALWATGGGALTLAAALLLPRGDNKATVVPPLPPSTNTTNQVTRVQIMTLFDCQYMSFSDPFFILHLPQCSNCVARSRQVVTTLLPHQLR